MSVRYHPWMARLPLIFALSACSLEPPGGFDFDSEGSRPAQAENGSTGDEGSSDDVVRVDPPEAFDLPPVLPTACGAVDVLFVIDNSGSMVDDQPAVAASAPGFIQALETLGVGAEGGLHIGVITTDDYNGNPMWCQAAGSLVTVGEVGDCGPYSSGSSYLTEADDLEYSVACALDPVSGSDYEMPTYAALEALDPWPNSPGGCNEGFHRTGWTDGDHWEERAALVLVYITDEDDHSPSTVQTMAAHLEWLRGGSLHDTILVAIAGGDCVPEQPERIQMFADLLPYSHFGTICASDFAPVFAAALPAVADGCGVEYDPVP